MYPNNNKAKGGDSSRFSYGRQPTGNMKTYSNIGLRHDQKTTGLNHQTHPDQLQHRQKDSFGR